MGRGYAGTAALAWLIAAAGPAGADARLFVLDERVDEAGIRFAVEPPEHRLELGGEVRWRNDGSLPRILEERSGLFRWGPIAPGATLTFEPWAAGTYRFRDAAAAAPGVGELWDRGRFSVEPGFEFLRTAWKDRLLWSVRWGSGPAPEGLVYEVQALRRDGRRWLPWKAAASRPSGVYRGPPQGSPYRPYCVGFRARLVDPADPERRLGWGANPVLCWVA